MDCPKASTTPSRFRVSPYTHWTYIKLISANQPKLAPTPRNLNMSLVREVIFKAAPNSLAPHHFPALTSAVVAAPCLGHYLECRQDLSGYERHPYASDEDDFAAKSRYVSRVQAEQGAEAREIRDFVRAFDSIGASAIPFIVTIHVNDTMNPNRFMNLFPGLFWPPFRLSSSYHFLDLPLHDDAMTFQCTLTPAYCLRGVVHFAEDAHSHPTHMSKKLLTSWLSTMFAGSRNTEGRIYLSGLAPLLLSMTEFSSVSSEKGQELAAVKLFDDIAFPPEFSRWSRSQKWTYFSSRVKVVNRDYRQSLKDLTEVLIPGPSTSESVIHWFYADQVDN